MHRETERTPMHRQKRAAAEQRMRLHCVLRPQMDIDIAPSGVKCADFQHHQIERPEPLADQLIFRREAGIAAKKIRCDLANE